MGLGGHGWFFKTLAAENSFQLVLKFPVKGKTTTTTRVCRLVDSGRFKESLLSNTPEWGKIQWARDSCSSTSPVRTQKNMANERQGAGFRSCEDSPGAVQGPPQVAPACQSEGLSPCPYTPRSHCWLILTNSGCILGSSESTGMSRATSE